MIQFGVFSFLWQGTGTYMLFQDFIYLFNRLWNRFFLRALRLLYRKDADTINKSPYGH